MRRLYNPIDRHLFEGFHLRRLVLTNDQLSDAEFLARGDHDEIVLDNNEQLWSGPAASTTDRKRTRRLSLRNTSIDSLSQRGVDISQFADVEELILAGNELRAVSAAELGPFERLRVLDLSDNSVDQFAGNFSSVLPRLDTLNLTDNRLETLPESTWRLLLPSFPDFPAFPCLFSPCPLFSPPMFSHFFQFFPTRVDVAPSYSRPFPAFPVVPCLLVPVLSPRLLRPIIILPSLRCRSRRGARWSSGSSRPFCSAAIDSITLGVLEVGPL